jgi:CMP-N-acetylneuraminic acid synthetase
MNALAIIPARGGSKAVLRKNIRLVAGLPLIAYTIKSAQASRSLARFAVSTEDDEIAEISKSFGCEVILRPPELAEDDTPTVPVVQHVFSVFDEKGEHFDYGVVLQPTSPLRRGADIDAALKILHESDADSVVSVYQVSDHHPARMYRLVEGRLVPYDDSTLSMRRQDLPPVYHRNGAVYAFRRRLLDQNTLLGQVILPYIMPVERSLNIDNEMDLMLADLILGK